MTTITERWLIRAVTGNIAEQRRDEPGSPVFHTLVDGGP